LLFVFLPEYYFHFSLKGDFTRPFYFYEFQLFTNVLKINPKTTFKFFLFSM
jgi:hypothetical protein